MSSGQIFPLMANPPGVNYALEDTFLGTSTGAGKVYESFPVWKFDAATTEFMDLFGMAVGYGAGGYTARIHWFTTSTATSTAVLGGAFRRLAQATEGFATTPQIYDFNNATDSNTATAGALQYTTITFTDGADSDSVANNESFVFRIQRLATATGDLYAGAIYILQDVTVHET